MDHCCIVNLKQIQMVKPFLSVWNVFCLPWISSHVLDTLVYVLSCVMISFYEICNVIIRFFQLISILVQKLLVLKKNSFCEYFMRINYEKSAEPSIFHIRFRSVNPVEKLLNSL